MVKSFNISNLNVSIVFRHKWDGDSNTSINYMFRSYELGLWYKNSRIVGRKNISDVDAWDSNLVTQHMIGVNLLVAKLWVSIDWNGMHFGGGNNHEHIKE